MMQSANDDIKLAIGLLFSCGSKDGDASPDAIDPAVVAAPHQMAAELRDGALITVEPDRTRLRVLPLGR